MKYRYIGREKYWDETNDMWVLPGQTIDGEQRMLSNRYYDELEVIAEKKPAANKKTKKEDDE